MHSYHYFNTPKYHEIRPSEKYARSIGLEIEKQNWPNVIVKESKRYRHYKRLTDQYDAKWIIDLHSNDGFKKLPKKGQFLSRFYCGHNWKLGESFFETKSFQMLMSWKLDVEKNIYQQQGIDIDVAPRRPPNLIGVELYTYNSRSKNIEFLKSFVNYLHQNPL